MPPTSSASQKVGLKGAYASASVQARGGWRKVSHSSRNRIPSTSQQILPTTHGAASTPHLKQEGTGDIEAYDLQSHPSSDEDDVLVPGRVESSRINNARSSTPKLLGEQRSKPSLQTKKDVTARQLSRLHTIDSENTRRSARLESLATLQVRSSPFPSLEERCRELVTKAQAVIGYYDQWRTYWAEEAGNDEIITNARTTSEMLSYWEPFHTYKTNYLVEGSQFHHHFILVEEHASLLLPQSSKILPPGVEEALRLANLATFTHYFWNLPITDVPEGDVRCPEVGFHFRSLPELQDAWRVFWRIIVPPSYEAIDDAVWEYLHLSLLLLSARLEPIEERLQAGEISARTAMVEVRDIIKELLGPDAIREPLRASRMSGRKAQIAVRAWNQRSTERRRGLQGLDHSVRAIQEELWGSTGIGHLQLWVQEMAEDATEGLMQLYPTDPVHDADLGPIRSVSNSFLSQTPVRQSGIKKGTMLVREINEDQGDILAASDYGIDANQLEILPRKILRHPRHNASPLSDENIGNSSQAPGWLKDLVAGPTGVRPTASTSGHSGGTEETQMSMSNSQVMRLLTLEEREAALAEMFSQSQAPPSLSVYVESEPADKEGPSAVSPSGYAVPSAGRESSVMSDDLSLDFSIANGQILHKPSGSARRIKAIQPNDAKTNARDAQMGLSSARSPVLQFQIRSGRIERMPAGKPSNVFKPTGKGVRLTRFDSQSVSEVSQHPASASAVRQKDLYAKKKTVTIDGTPSALRSRADLDASQSSRPAPSDARAVRHGRPRTSGNATFTDVLIDLPSDQIKQVFHPPLRVSAQPPIPLTRAAARRQEEQQKSLAQLKDFAGRLSVIYRNQADERGNLIEAITNNDEMPAMPVERPAEGRELLPPQAVEADANHFGNLGTFEGDHDPEVREARKQLSLEYWFRRVRPGFEHFPQPTRTSPSPVIVSQQRAAHRDAVLLPGGQDVELPQSSEAANRSQQIVEVVINSRNDDVEESSEHEAEEVVPGTRRSERLRQARRSATTQHGRRGQGQDRAPSDSSEDELDDVFGPEASASPGASPSAAIPASTDTFEPSGQKTTGRPTRAGARVREPWTSEETSCFLDAMYKLARKKRIKPSYPVYAEILSRHGPLGSDDTILKNRDNGELKAKARVELLRMAREGAVLPYWKSLYWDSLFQTRPGKAALRAGEKSMLQRGSHTASQRQAQRTAERTLAGDQEFEDALMRDVFEAQSENVRAGDDAELSAAREGSREPDASDLVSEQVHRTDGSHNGEEMAVEADDGVEAYRLDDEEEDEDDELTSAQSSPQTSVDELELEPDLQSQQMPTAVSPTPESLDVHHTPPPSSRRTPPPSALKSPHQPRSSRAGSHVHFEDDEEESRSGGRHRTTSADIDHDSHLYSRSHSPTLRDRLTTGPAQVLKRGRDLVRELSLGISHRDEETAPSSRCSLPPGRLASEEVEGDHSPRKRLRSQPSSRGSRASAPPAVRAFFSAMGTANPASSSIPQRGLPSSSASVIIEEDAEEREEVERATSEPLEERPRSVLVSETTGRNATGRAKGRQTTVGTR